jgi:hypothetical protein
MPIAAKANATPGTRMTHRVVQRFSRLRLFARIPPHSGILAVN